MITLPPYYVMPIVLTFVAVLHGSEQKNAGVLASVSILTLRPVAGRMALFNSKNPERLINPSHILS